MKLLVIFLILSTSVVEIKSDPRRDQREPFLIQRDIIDEWIDYFKEKLFSKNENFPKTNLPSQTDTDNKEHMEVRNSFSVFCFVVSDII